MSEVRAGDLVMSLQTHEVSRGDQPVQLTPLEFRILYMLAMNEGQVIPYARLVDYAWGYEGGDANLLKTHICHIRQKLDLPLDGEGSIRALPTVGYSLLKRKNDASVPMIDARNSTFRSRYDQLSDNRDDLDEPNDLEEMGAEQRVAAG